MPSFPYRAGIVSPPPAPFVDILIQHVLGGKSYSVKALLDTGSDMCAVPRAIAEEGRWNAWRRVRVVTPVGISLRPLHHVAFEVFSARMPVLAVECEQDFAIIGRVVLNRFVMRLDGPGLQIEIT